MRAIRDNPRPDFGLAGSVDRGQSPSPEAVDILLPENENDERSKLEHITDNSAAPTALILLEQFPGTSDHDNTGPLDALKLFIARLDSGTSGLTISRGALLTKKTAQPHINAHDLGCIAIWLEKWMQHADQPQSEWRQVYLQNGLFWGELGVFLGKLITHR